MKNQLKDNAALNVPCQQHKQKCTFVCLHKTCQNSFKIGCVKCRKDHGQHPNRLISIVDFHTMLSKPIRYIQNSTAFKLMNLKKKVEYIRNFRTSILQKQISLIDSNKNIKSTATAILEQHYQIRNIVSHLNAQSLTHQPKDYIQFLLKSKEFLAFNPVKGDLVFNNEVIKSSRVALQKHLKNSHELIDSIRQFLVKIIQVLLANCAYQEDDDDIQFDEQGDNATNFNIFIKNRIDVMEIPNIKSKLEHEAFLQMFDQQKDALNKQVDMLQKELDIKVGILNKIRNTNGWTKQSQASGQSVRSSFEEDLKSQEKEQQLKPSQEDGDDDGDSTNLKQTQGSIKDNQIFNSKIIQIREEYQTILANKQQYIQQLKHICSKLQEQISNVNGLDKNFSPQKFVQKTIYQSTKINLEKESNLNKSLNQRIKQLQITYIENLQKNQNLTQLLQKSKHDLQQLRSAGQTQLAQLKKNSNKQIAELTKKEQLLTTQLTKIGEQIQKKDKDIAKQKKKYQQLQKMVQKMKENSATSQKQLLRWRDEHQMREKRLRVEVQTLNKQMENLHYKVKSDADKIKHLQMLNKQLNRQIDVKNNQMKQKQKQFKSREQAYKQKNQASSSRIKQLQNELRNSQNTQSTLKNYESQSKKFRQMKEMLEISIRKNQQLKDKNYRLQNQLQQYKSQFKNGMNKYNSQVIPNVRKSFCFDQKPYNHNNNIQLQLSKPIKTQTMNCTQIVDIPTSLIKKKQLESVLQDKKVLTNKTERKQAYLQIKSIFKAVTEDMGLLQERLKQNNVIEKVYLKELQRKRLQNKTLKKELQNIKLYGGNFKQNDTNRASSPYSKGIDKDKGQLNTQPFGITVIKSDSQSGLAKKNTKPTK